MYICVCTLPEIIAKRIFYNTAVTILYITVNSIFVRIFTVHLSKYIRMKKKSNKTGNEPANQKTKPPSAKCL